MSELQPVSFRKGRAHEPRHSEPYVPGRRSERYWTKAEDDIIREHYAKGGYGACLPHLGKHRDRKAIYRRANLLQVPAPRGGGSGKQRIVAPEGFDDKIRAFYQSGDGKKKGECNAFADAHNLPRWWVTKQAIRLGLVIAHRKEPPWTAAEDQLMRSVPLHDPNRCAEIFREHGFARSPTAIVVRCKRLDLSRRYRETLSANAISRILGVDSKYVTAEIIAGELAATKRETKRTIQQGGHPWSVTPADLRSYILKRLDRIDLRKVEKFAFIQIVAGEPLETPQKGAA